MPVPFLFTLLLPQPLRSPFTSHIPFNTVLLSCLCRAIVDVKDSSARWLAGRILRSNESKPYSSTADPFIPPNLPSRSCYRSYLHDEIVGIEDEIERLHIAFKEGDGKGEGRGKGKGKRIAIGKETENDSDSDSGIEIVDEERQEDGVDGAEIDFQSQRNYESEGGSGGISVDAHSCSEESETTEGTKSHSLTQSHSTSHSHSAARPVTRSQCRSIGQTLSKADEDRSDSILRVKRKFNDVEKASVCNATSKASTAAVKSSTSTLSSSTSSSTSLLATATAEAEASISDGSNQMESTTLIPSFCSIADSTSSPKPVDSTPIVGPGSNSEHEQESGIIAPQGLESAGNIGADPGSNSMNTADPPTTASLPASSAYPGLCQIDSDEAFAR